MPYAMREYRPSDAALMPEIFRSAVSVSARRHYNDRQVTVWLSRTPNAETFAENYSNGRLAMMIVNQENRPVGFADVEEDGHIQYFYCHPELSGSGMADVLLRAIEVAARGRKLSRLYVEASETALGLFKRNGFDVVKRRDFKISGVPIHNYAMEKVLK